MPCWSGQNGPLVGCYKALLILLLTWVGLLVCAHERQALLFPVTAAGALSKLYCLTGMTTMPVP